MAELETELNNAVDDAQEVTQAPETAADTTETTKPQTIQEALNQSENTQEVQELWKQSNQFKQGLWRTPDDIMNSVQYYEKKFQPLEQSLKRMGFNEPSELEQAFKEYQEKLPTYQANEETINLLNALLQNENYGSKLRAAFDEIRKAQEMERYGITFDQLPAVIQEKVTKGEQAFQQLEEMKQQQAYDSALNTIQDQMAQIEQIVNETGCDFDKQAFLEHCRDNNIPPNAMKGEFLNSHYTQMLEKAKQNASLATTAQNKQNKAKALNSSTKQQGAEAPKEIKTEQDLKAALLAIE